MRPFRNRTRTAPSSTQQKRSDQRGGDPADEFVRVAAELDVLDGSAPADPVPQGGRGGRLAVLTNSLIDTAPRIPVRDLAALRAQHPKARTPEDLADRLASGAAKASGVIGAGVGAAAMLPVPPAIPLEIAGEMLAVAAVEIKLIAELYQAYGQPVSGSAAQRAAAYLSVWSQRRGLDLSRPGTVMVLGGSAELRRQLRRRLARSGIRKLPSLAPMMVGAGAGAYVNRRDTAKLAEEIRRDLRSRPPVDPDYWA
ncbi:hypothetical protein GXW83_26205 [Streptacidiphilus sp. PB12-B1b]|uniref:hypothetical protein n=1 Tax=Streptacidiphilus sp. PB12-B1b TaxID=2705012 RepID=UPI0015FDF9BD|nr:hypothetical protein [Streptacidiphilus sp. PB12-B1b]QMU78680.1 hypothetical protein GXW83_26205 [Streptacidiphilus sp. PB12-B1b]